jgi:integrase
METIAAFLEEVRKILRLRHRSIRTEAVYLKRIKQFIRFHDRKHPRNMGGDEIREYLSYLAIEGNVAASTQNVALAAILFLYRDVLHIDLPKLEGIERAQRPQRLPVVFTRQEVAALLSHLQGVHHVTASLLYGSGLRLMECAHLRVKDIDFGTDQITVRHGKGHKDPVTMRPRAVKEPRERQLLIARALHERDLAAG